MTTVTTETHEGGDPVHRLEQQRRVNREALLAMGVRPYGGRTLGIVSIAEARATRYIVDRLSIDGDTDWQSVNQNPDALLASGEGLAEAFNVDGF